MLKINFPKKHKKQAQHVLELALVLPLIIIVFSVFFQLMCDSYRNYKFSYIFTNTVNETLKEGTVFNDQNALSNYTFQSNRIKNLAQNQPNDSIGDFIFLDRLEAKLKRQLPGNNTIEAYAAVISDNILFVQCSFNMITKAIIGEVGGASYFFTIPINRIYTEPVISSKTDNDLRDYFFWFYTAIEKNLLTDDETSENKGEEGEKSEEDKGDETEIGADDTGIGGEG